MRHVLMPSLCIQPSGARTGSAVPATWLPTVQLPQSATAKATRLVAPFTGGADWATLGAEEGESITEKTES